ncbi:SMI1/KNR4 family protein [Kibdelosporangium aridum]|uniref:SMI1/KNR4 family protein n=1 Tax=Kibdelosporangium aridum TaxID=2030 RepID=UPI000526571C
MDIDGIVAKVQLLHAADQGYRNVPVSLESVERVEDVFNVRLPQGFREFLLKVGPGSGPYYGITAPNELITEISDRDPAGEFPLTRDDAERAYRDWRSWLDRPDSTGGPSLEAPFELPGCISIGPQGCAGESMLVTTGELAGTMWDNWADSWRPAKSGVEGVYLGPTPTFEEWYDAWLTEALTKLTR